MKYDCTEIFVDVSSCTTLAVGSFRTSGADGPKHQMENALGSIGTNLLKYLISECF